MTVQPIVAAVEQATGGTGASGAGRRIGRGLAANVAGSGVSLAIQFVSVPILLAAWGVPTYGEWLVLSAVPAYVALSDLSFSSVAGNSMVMLEARGHRAEAVLLGRRLWSIVTVMTVVVALTAIAIALAVAGTIGSRAISGSEARIVLSALFVQVAVINQHGVLDAWYRVGSRYPLGTGMRHFGRLLEFGATIGVVFLGAGPAGAAVAFLAGSLIGLAASWLVLRRAVPWSSFRLERPHLQTFRELLAPGLAFMAFPIGTAFSWQGFTIAIRGTLGPAAVVVFSTTRTMTRLVLQAMASISNSVWPELSRSVGGGHPDEARAILRRAVQASVAVSLLLVAFLAFFGPTIIRWWTDGMVLPSHRLLYVLLLVNLANCLWFALSAVLAATNRHKGMAVVYLGGTILALLVAIPLSSAFGLVGVAVALLAIDALMVLHVVPTSLRIVEDRPGPFLRAMLSVPAIVRLGTFSRRSPRQQFKAEDLNERALHRRHEDLRYRASRRNDESSR